VPASVGAVGDKNRASYDATAQAAIAAEATNISSFHPSAADGERETFHGLVVPTEEELSTLRRVAGKLPMTCYLLCAVEFAERASYYGCFQVYKNFIRAPLPPDGNGTGASAPGSQYTAGALGKGSVTATAMTEAFKFMTYALPLYFGWLADTKYGRFKMICWGVAICGLAHIIMIISALPPVLLSGNAIGPFALSLYMLAIGAAQVSNWNSSFKFGTTFPYRSFESLSALQNEAGKGNSNVIY
jgi:dipeptide/tripeptide permease